MFWRIFWRLLARWTSNIFCLSLRQKKMFLFDWSRPPKVRQWLSRLRSTCSKRISRAPSSVQSEINRYIKIHLLLLCPTSQRKIFPYNLRVKLNIHRQTEVQKFLYEAFRSLFPRIKPSQVMVDNIRRVVLLHYDKEKDQGKKKQNVFCFRKKN